MIATLTARDLSLLISTLLVHTPAFCPNLSRVFPVLAVTDTGYCVGPQNKVGHPADLHRRLMQVLVLSARGM